jgi:hypothetical protein
MNAYKHAEISVHKRGGKIEDYYEIHDFMDCTKELCSDNRHRILHNLWGIRRVIVPIFGATIRNSDGKVVNVKDLCEQDHILPDYGNKFIPTLADFANAIKNEATDLPQLNTFFKEYEEDNELVELLLSPLNMTGKISSLWITHNSWFLNFIVPKVLKRKPTLRSYSLSPTDLFERMDFKLWMDNGAIFPPSSEKSIIF